MKIILQYTYTEQLQTLDLENYRPPAPNWPYLALWMKDQFTLINMDIVRSFSIEGGENDRSIPQNTMSGVSREYRADGDRYDPGEVSGV